MTLCLDLYAHNTCMDNLSMILSYFVQATGAWIGLLKKRGDWTWVAGVEWGFRHWFQRGPGTSNERCVNIGFSGPTDDRWNYVGCSSTKIPYICMLQARKLYISTIPIYCCNFLVCSSNKFPSAETIWPKGILQYNVF